MVYPHLGATLGRNFTLGRNWELGSNTLGEGGEGSESITKI
jgi:hypothetical protein